MPFASKRLLPQRDVWGEPIKREGGLGPDIISPLPVSTRKNDPVNAEAIAVGAVIGRPPRGDMTQQEYNEFLHLSGQLHKQAMVAWMAYPGWGRMTAEDKRKAFDREKKAARMAAKEQVLGEGAVPPPPAGFVRVR